MKKVLQVICCAVGSGMIGFFANQLNTVVGSVCFTLGVALLVGSIFLYQSKIKRISKFQFVERNSVECWCDLGANLVQHFIG